MGPTEIKEHFLLMVFFKGGSRTELHHHSYPTEEFALQQAKYHASCGHTVDVYHVTSENNNVHSRFRVLPAEIRVERL